MNKLLDCPCGGKATYHYSIGVLSATDQHMYFCSNKHKTGCRLITAGWSRDESVAAKKWNKAVSAFNKTKESK